ncbi:alkanesulfonate monooxygenase SsuD/methylene tetrahydromethanopterin reductase-like flavin-dependent oxidoreductase (luciferase family) [Nocardia transvalensis]|uniref:Alkanesulfonate monooxygenase SsuD/methylene tetrahydromethanopterin reductase-like flavin-dependent oxidoreductase (Luciferase family) n=1 Tax=Nocardia transvalensis TaxID=37333 RepID=A0A7W9PCP1_9NOCA|nr:LLM class flavin-dependent oxidoreductase [Nocardia transvalensis]MBB5913525.1 alkanesulfonate monooxygenase SsuD/methylene tetrahydromethanopterin reductase-like flavin-dependent oxidoreductase (luciferase family) [Nocardia transvalensis]
MTLPNPLLLGVEFPGTGTHPASWRRADSRAEELFTAGYWLEAVRVADAAGIDFAFLPDSFALQAEGATGRLEAVGIAARVAADTRRIGLIPQAPVTHTEPFHVSKAVASLDFASHGRAGWEVAVSRGQSTLFGRKAEQEESSLWREADDAVEVVTRLWDSWEDDAEIRDVATGRFIDRGKLHYIDFAGEHFSVKGPSITPRSPQAQPLIAVRVADPHSTRVAVHRADLIRIAAPDLPAAAQARSELRGAIAAAGRDPNLVRVLIDIDVHLAATEENAELDVAQLEAWTPTRPRESLRHIGTPGSLRTLIEEVRGECAGDGVVLRPLALAAFTAQLPRLAPTLRDRLGLPRPANRYATA